MGDRASARVGEPTTLRYEFREVSNGELYEPNAVDRVEIMNADFTLRETINGANLLHDGVGQWRVVASAINTQGTYLDRIWYRDVAGDPLLARVGQFTVSAVLVESQADAAIKDHVRTRLGSSMVEVELADDDLNSALATAKRWLAAYFPLEREMELTLVPGTSVYAVSDTCWMVTEVHLDQMGTSSDFELPDGSVDLFGDTMLEIQNRVNGSLSAYAESRSYLELQRRVLSGELGWSWRQQDRRLVFKPPPRSAQTALVRYVEDLVNSEALGPDQWDLLLRMVLALSKQTLGRALRKHRGVTSVQGTIETDGDMLFTEGQEEEQTLRVEIGEHFGGMIHRG